MAEGKSASYEELIKQIDDFEKTISDLVTNVTKLKKKLAENREKYGPDISAWPKEAK